MRPVVSAFAANRPAALPELSYPCAAALGMEKRPEFLRRARTENNSRLIMYSESYILIV